MKAVSLQKLMFLPDFADQEKMLDREVTILKRLRHDRIVNLHDFYKTEHYWYLVMELVCGGELFHNIPPNRGMGEYEAAYTFIQLLEGIGYIHSQGVIHRDLKPENILIVGSRPAPSPHSGKLRDVKIADFGLGKVGGGDASPAKSCVGSPVYVAPEVILVGRHGGSYGREVDLWSLGAVLFVMLCGQYPFDGKSVPREITLGAVDQIRGCVSNAVDMVELHLMDGHVRTYGSGDTSPCGPWQFASDERVVAVMQQSETRQDCLGSALVFLTSAGRFLSLEGATACQEYRFAANPGTQITGLVFEGSRLTGINVLPVNKAKSDSGVVKQIQGWVGAAVDGIEIRHRDGTVQSYGAVGGAPTVPVELQPDELIIAAVQTHHDGYLGSAITLVTSAGTIVEIAGTEARPTNRFAVAAGAQIDRLVFVGSMLKEVRQVPQEELQQTANFKMESAQWRQLTDEAKDLIRRLLQVAPASRLKLDECYSQAWIKNSGLPVPEEEFFEFVKRGSNPDAIAAAAAMAALSTIDEQVAGVPEGWAPGWPAEGQGEVQPELLAQINGRAGSAVDRLELRPRVGATLVYGGHGGQPVGPWTLQLHECLVAVDQETRGGRFGYLGNAFGFYTSLGNVITLAGKHACACARFAVGLGLQIVGLEFQGSRLVGVRSAPLNPAPATGAVAQISGRTGSALDHVEFRLRSGEVLSYGGTGGHPRGPWDLDTDEYILAVLHEFRDRDEYLSNAFILFTSGGRTIAIEGDDARQRQCFSATEGFHISGFRFDGGTLVEVEVDPLVGQAAPQAPQAPQADSS